MRKYAITYRIKEGEDIRVSVVTSPNLPTAIAWWCSKKKPVGVQYEDILNVAEVTNYGQ